MIAEMDYGIRSPTRTQVRDLIVDGFIAESLTVPLIIATLLRHVVSSQPIRWYYLATAVGFIILAATYLAFVVIRRKRRGMLLLLPEAAFVIVCVTMTTVSLLDLSIGKPVGLYLPVIPIEMLLVAVFGDRSMRLLILLFGSLLIGWTTWLEGSRGVDFTSRLLIYICIGLAITSITSRTVRSTRSGNAIREGLKALAEAIESAGSAEEGARLGMPLINRVLPTDHVVLYGREDSKSVEVNLLNSWPVSEAADTHLGDSSGAREALSLDTVVVTGEHCFVPIGYGESQKLLLVVRHARRRGETHELFLETAEALAGVFLKMTARVTFESGVNNESRTDPLTGLANHRGLIERLDLERARSVRLHTPLSAAMIDLDRFKVYNETFGQLAGDNLLRSVAATVSATVRAQDLVSRFGGEEFCLLLPDTNLEGANILMEKVRRIASEIGGEHRVTLSIGLTDWDGSESSSKLIERLNRALSIAKDHGRDQVTTIGYGAEV